MIAQLNNTYLRTRPWKAYSRLVAYLLYEGRPLTTRGQWLNPIVFAYLALQKRMPFKGKVEKPIFITGIGRSGSTMLGVLLSMHRQVGLLNEPKALWHSVVPHEDVIGNYTSGPARYRLTAHDATTAVKRQVRLLYRSFLAVSGSKRVVDKYPELVYRIPFLLEIFPDAKIIFLVRNGENVCRSVRGWSVGKGIRMGEQVHDWWGRDRRKWRFMISELVTGDPFFSSCVDTVRAMENHTDMAAVEWIVSMREGLRAAGSYPRQVYTVRYEDILAAPAEKLAELLDFCELEGDGRMIAYAARSLRPSTAYKPPGIDPDVAPLFYETMDRLGYAHGR